MTIPSNCAYKTVPAAKELQKVPQFDPLKYLRKTISQRTGEKVLKLDLRYKKMWFHFAYPNGRMLLTPLRVTDQMAMFEACLFSSQENGSLLAQFTARTDRKDTGGQYIQVAQDNALDQALDNAGFGIQFADLIEPINEHEPGSEVLLSQVEALLRKSKPECEQDRPLHNATDCTTASKPVQAAPAQPEPRPVVASADTTQADADVSLNPNDPTSSVQSEPTTNSAEKPVVEDNPNIPLHGAQAEPAADSVPDSVSRIGAKRKTGPAPATDKKETETNETADLLQMLGAVPATTNNPVPPQSVEKATVVDFPKQPEENVSPLNNDAHGAAVCEDKATVLESESPTGSLTTNPAATYSEDMTVDEIRERMTIDQARALLVTFGPNNGWTLGQVFERRPSSLRFYALVSKDASNSIKAGSYLLLDEMTRQRAG